MKEREKLVWVTSAIVGAFLVMAAYIAAPARYSMTGDGAGIAYRLDTHTGTVMACARGVCRPADIQAASVSEAPASENTAAMNMADPMMDGADPGDTFFNRYFEQQKQREAATNSN